MPFSPLLIFALAVAVAWGSSGCSSTKIVNQWINPDYASPRFTKILVIGVSRQPSIRRTFEDEFVAKLEAAGVNAEPSYRYIPEDGEADVARVREAVKQAKADAAIIHATGPGGKKDRDFSGLLATGSRPYLRLL